MTDEEFEDQFDSIESLVRGYFDRFDAKIDEILADAEEIKASLDRSLAILDGMKQDRERRLDPPEDPAG
jgi:hypothetical protein